MLSVCFTGLSQNIGNELSGASMEMMREGTERVREFLVDWRFMGREEQVED